MSTHGVRVELPELLALRANAATLASGARRRSREASAGPMHSAFRGRGMEYAESRPYTPGDDVRHMDWRVTARTGKPHSKLFQAERDHVTALLLDRAPAMHFGTRSCLKLVQAVRIAALAAWLGHAEGDRIAAWSGQQHAPPLRGRRGALRALAALAAWTHEPPLDDALSPALDAAARLLHPGSHVLVLADQRSVDDALCDRLRRLAAHNDVAVMLVLDPIELDAPPAGLYPAVDDAHRAVLGLGQADREQWSWHFRQRLDQARAALRRAGASVGVVRTTDDPVRALGALLRGSPLPTDRVA